MGQPVNLYPHAADPDCVLGMDLPSPRPEPEVEGKSFWTLRWSATDPFGIARALDAKVLSDLGNMDHCYDFFADILRYALHMGQNDDKRWIAVYAATRLRGSAMRWYTLELDDASKSDWNKFQAAILRKADTLSPSETAFSR